MKIRASALMNAWEQHSLRESTVKHDPMRAANASFSPEERQMSGWVKVRREGGEAPEPTPFIAIRRQGVAFNAAFVRSASLLPKTHVSV